MKPNRRNFCLPLMLACALGAAAQTQTAVKLPAKLPAKPAVSPAQAQIVNRARQAYYNLRTSGLDEFQSTVKPNWEIVLKNELQASPENAKAALKLLNGIHFSMLLDSGGKVTMTHHADMEPSNEQQRSGFDQIYSGMDQAVSGFFATWAVFMLNSPFPSPDGDYQLDDLGTQWRLSYKDGASDVVTLMSKQLIISEVKVVSAEFISAVRPQFSRTAQGFVLTGYTADYKPTSGPGVVKLDVKIEHQPVNGLQLPVNLIADSVLDGAPTHIELAFSGHTVKSH
jgi:hypothetical protein